MEDRARVGENQPWLFRTTNDMMAQKRWKPTTQRTFTLMNVAHRLAVEKHDAITKSRIGLPARRPSKAITQSQKTRKRSAEICRLKFPIFIDLLENAYSQELQACVNLKRRLCMTYAKVEYTKNRIALSEQRQTRSELTFDNDTSPSMDESSTYRCSGDRDMHHFLNPSNSLVKISDDSSLQNSFLDLD